MFKSDQEVENPLATLLLTGFNSHRDGANYVLKKSGGR